MILLLKVRHIFLCINQAEFMLGQVGKKQGHFILIRFQNL